MTTPCCLTKDECEKIRNHFGVDFLHKVLKDIDYYADKWSLSNIQFIPSYSAKVVFFCNAEKYGDVVLKIGNPFLVEIIKEFNTLCRYKGRSFSTVFEADVENGVILEEWVKPGTPLRDESSLKKRLSVFCSLYKGMHITPVEGEIHSTYTEWIERITEYMSTRQDCRELYQHMKKARDIYSSVSTMYSNRLLLHGDLHHDNILLRMDGEYVIIDPKGVIGDPIFDVARFILNEFDDENASGSYKKINHIISILESELSIPNSILRQCLYVETLMSVCWCVEDGEEYSSVKKKVDLVEAILDGSSLHS